MHIEVLVSHGSDMDTCLAVGAFQGALVIKLLCISVVLTIRHVF